MVAEEQLQSDFSMACRVLQKIYQERDDITRNAMHVAITVYLNNLLTHFEADADDFRQRAQDQVLTLTERRTSVMAEKLNTPDYIKVLELIESFLKAREGTMEEAREEAEEAKEKPST